MEHIPFGVFNPRFYGVSILLGEGDRLDTLADYHLTPDIRGWVEDGRSSDAEEIFSISALDHEVRHFHDFLLSPLGTTTMGLRMQASINGFQAMQALQRCQGRFVPVPLARWMQWDLEERQRWVQTTGQFFGVASLDDIVSIPHADHESASELQPGTHDVPESLADEQKLQTYAIATAQAYRAMEGHRKQRFGEYGIEVTADDIFEATAHLVQAQAVWIGQGESAAQQFINFLSASNSKHLLPLQILWRQLHQTNANIGTERLTELFTWMMLGSSDGFDAVDHPAVRYFHVLTVAVLESGSELLGRQMPVEQLFGILDGTMQTDWTANLKAAAASADRLLAAYERAGRKLKGGYFDALFATAHAWHADQRAMKTRFLQDPESYTNPLRYVKSPTDSFPLPFIETRLGWKVHERDTATQPEDHRAIAIDADGKNVISYISRMTDARTSEALDHAFATRIMTHMVDFLFADEPVMDGYETWCRAQITRLIGKALVSVY